MGKLLQEVLNDFACTELNYSNNKILVWHFYSEERYEDFLIGSKCWAGQGFFDEDEILEFNKLGDNILIVVKHNNIETSRHKYVPIFKATMEYKILNTLNKFEYKTLTFKIRKSIFDGMVNYIQTVDNISLDFYNLSELKSYLVSKYGNYKLTDWSVIDWIK